MTLTHALEHFSLLNWMAYDYNWVIVGLIVLYLGIAASAGKGNRETKG